MLPCCKASVFNSLHKPKAYPKQLISLGDHIKARRLDLGLQHKDLAKIFNVSIATINYWENHPRNPSSYYYKRISDFLGYCLYEPAPTLANKLFNIRTYLYGMTSREFAEFAKLDESSIQQWEQGNKLMHINSYWKLVDAIGFEIPFNENEVYNPSANIKGHLPDEPPRKIGSKIKKARESKRLTARMAAKRLGVALNTYLCWEKNIKAPNDKNQEEIMKFINSLEKSSV